MINIENSLKSLTFHASNKIAILSLIFIMVFFGLSVSMIYAATITDDTQIEFNAGTYDDTQWDGVNSWVELDATGITNGSGSYVSSIKDMVDTNAIYNSIAWEPQRPIGKELPDNKGQETIYDSGNADMTGNVLLMHLNESSGNITDSSGQSNNGTYNGSLYSQTGKLNTAIGFDGTDDYVSIGNHASLNPGYSDFTVEMWVKVYNKSGNQGVLTKGYSPAYGIYHTAVNDEIALYLQSGSAHNGIVITSYYDQWIHVVWTVDNGGNIQYSYLNGVFDHQTNNPVGNVTSTYDLNIGRYTSAGGSYFQGSIDEVVIYNRILSPTEILDHYKRGVLHFKHQVRSCDDSSCSGESFIGPDGTNTDYYEWETTNSTNTPSFNLTNVSNNRYFQYKTFFETDTSSYTPELKSVTFETDPTVSSFSPADDTTDIATNSNLVITFDENVDAESGNIYLYKTSGDTLIQTFDVTSDISGSGTDTITINPTSDLDETTSYYVKIDATAFDDSSSNSYAGIADATTWDFTTADETNPTVSSFSPTDDATGVATNSNLVITFDENVDAETGNIYLYKTNGDTLIQTFDVTSDISGSGTDTITINPTSDLDETTSYYVKIDATAFDDSSSNSYAGINDTTTWNFTTADETPPTVSSFSPTDDATGVATNSNLVITFDENVDAETGNIYLYKTSGDTLIQTFDVTSGISGSGTDTITINPNSDLDEVTSYYVKIDATAFDDSSSNSYGGIADATTWNFTTADETCLVIPNAATYNTYPTCGVATCNSGYILTDGACVASGGGGYIPPASIGNGSADASIDISQTKTGYVIDIKGKNFLAHINSKIGFTVYGSDEKHVAGIEDLNMVNKKIKIALRSEPVIVYLFPKETKTIDLNGDGINDIKIKYNELVVNRIDLTFTKLENKEKIKEDTKEENTSIPEKQNYQFTRSLKVGMLGQDVKELQKFLNNNGFILSPTGQPGSSGYETIFFGRATKNALIKFQNKYFSEILKPVGLSVGTGYFGPSTIKFINSFGVKTVKKEHKPNQKQEAVKKDRNIPSLFTRGLARGMINNDVRRLQELLSTLPSIYLEGIISGYFGPLTEQAVQRFQLKYGVVKNSSDIGYGYVGPMTRKMLGEVFGK